MAIHIGKNGPEKCPAKKQCRLKDANGNTVPHFDSIEEAQKYIDTEGAKDAFAQLTNKDITAEKLSLDAVADSEFGEEISVTYSLLNQIKRSLNAKAIMSDIDIMKLEKNELLDLKSHLQDIRKSIKSGETSDKMNLDSLKFNLNFVQRTGEETLANKFANSNNEHFELWSRLQGTNDTNGEISKISNEELIFDLRESMANDIAETYDVDASPYEDLSTYIDEIDEKDYADQDKIEELHLKAQKEIKKFAEDDVKLAKQDAPIYSKNFKDELGSLLLEENATLNTLTLTDSDYENVYNHYENPRKFNRGLAKEVFKEFNTKNLSMNDDDYKQISEFFKSNKFSTEKRSGKTYINIDGEQATISKFILNEDPEYGTRYFIEHPNLTNKDESVYSVLKAKKSH